MKISYTHPKTENRTSLTLDNHLIRLWGISRGYDTSTDDFMYDKNIKAELNDYVLGLARSYDDKMSTFPTLVAFIENDIVGNAENVIRQLRTAMGISGIE
ncbi:hypothetical protein REH76_01560 [Photobacterium damselae]